MAGICEDEGNENLRLVFTCLECSQMPGVFYHSVYTRLRPSLHDPRLLFTPGFITAESAKNKHCTQTRVVRAKKQPGVVLRGPFLCSQNNKTRFFYVFPQHVSFSLTFQCFYNSIETRCMFCIQS